MIARQNGADLRMAPASTSNAAAAAAQVRRRRTHCCVRAAFHCVCLNVPPLPKRQCGEFTDTRPQRSASPPLPVLHLRSTGLCICNGGSPGAPVCPHVRAQRYCGERGSQAADAPACPYPGIGASTLGWPNSSRRTLPMPMPGDIERPAPLPVAAPLRASARVRVLARRCMGLAGVGSPSRSRRKRVEVVRGDASSVPPRSQSRLHSGLLRAYACWLDDAWDFGRGEPFALEEEHVEVVRGDAGRPPVPLCPQTQCRTRPPIIAHPRLPTCCPTRPHEPPTQTRMLVERVHALTGGGPPPIAPPLGPMLTHPVAVPPDTALLSVVAVPPDAALSSVVAVPPDAALSSSRSRAPQHRAIAQGCPTTPTCTSSSIPSKSMGFATPVAVRIRIVLDVPPCARACRRRPDPSLCKRAAWRGVPGARAARGRLDKVHSGLPPFFVHSAETLASSQMVPVHILPPERAPARLYAPPTCPLPSPVHASPVLRLCMPLRPHAHPARPYTHTARVRLLRTPDAERNHSPSSTLCEVCARQLRRRAAENPARKSRDMKRSRLCILSIDHTYTRHRLPTPLLRRRAQPPRLRTPVQLLYAHPARTSSADVRRPVCTHMSPARAQDTPATDAPLVCPLHTHTPLYLCKGARLAAEAHKIDLEEEDSLTLADQIDALINEAVQDFPDEDDIDSAAKYAAEIARAVIKDKTREGHLRIVKHYIAFHMRKNPEWEAMKYATAVSTRAALTYWYRTVRPNESVSEWRVDTLTHHCYGLPTRSRHVSEFMTGLEKTKAKAGEVSTSARALSLQDMHNLYDHCFKPNASPAQMRWGIVRYTAYLFAWLLLLRFEEVHLILNTRRIFRGAAFDSQVCADRSGTCLDFTLPTILTPRSVRFALLSDLRLYTEKPLL
ncbi:hypothetical protein B0H14DRAFT_3576850 [Mycena olivaceomarginata]|nr:hypothetical protein B0H14DRAFT_3576850 [Mycena olivaceomarginata]